MNTRGAVRVAFLAIVSLLAPWRESRAQWLPDGTPVANTAEGDGFARIASDGAGGALVVWLGGTPRAQRLDPRGFPLWTAGGIATLGADNVCADGAGGMYVVGSGLRVQRYTPAGVVAPGWPAEGVVAATPGGSIRPLMFGSVKLALSNDGSLLLGWSAFFVPIPHDALYRVAIQKLSGSGAPLWGDAGVEVVPYANGNVDPSISAIASDGSGGALLTWEDYREFTPVQRVDANGSTLWRPGGLPVSSPGGTRGRVLAPDGVGGAFVAWHVSGLSDIRVQHVAPDSTLLWGENGVSVCTASGQRLEPEVLGDGSGGVFVAWTDLRAPTQEVYVQRLRPTGARAPGWPPAGARAGAGGNCIEHVTLIRDALDGVLVTWGTSCFDDTVGDIRVQRLTGTGDPASGWPVDGAVACAAPGPQNHPFATTDGAGGVITAWNDRRTGQFQPTDVYAQRVLAGGGILGVVDGGAETLASMSAHPNPTFGRTTISLSLPVARSVTIEVVDLEGRIVDVLASRAMLGPGTHRFAWDGFDTRGRRAASGIYFVRLDGARTARRLALVH